MRFSVKSVLNTPGKSMPFHFTMDLSDVEFGGQCPAQEPVEVDGMFATCPICGEAYDLGSGYATPKKGISNEALRRYDLIVSNGVITIRN